MSEGADGRDGDDALRATAASLRLLVFAATLAVFHTVPALLPSDVADGFDLLTPFAVLAAGAWALASLRPSRLVLVAAAAAAVAYVDGHGIHLAANSIGHEAGGTAAEDVAHFWDEEFGHLEWHLGLLGLLGTLVAADRLPRPRARRGRLLAAAAAFLLGFTLFTNSVEGGTWALVLLATVPAVVAAARKRTLVALTIGAGFVLAAGLVAIWAAWHGGVPEFSDVGLI